MLNVSGSVAKNSEQIENLQSRARELEKKVSTLNCFEEEHEDDRRHSFLFRVILCCCVMSIIIVIDGCGGRETKT